MESDSLPDQRYRQVCTVDVRPPAQRFYKKGTQEHTDNTTAHNADKTCVELRSH